MRIMIADSHPEVRAALRLLLEEDSPTWIVVSEASNAIELINRARSANPRIVLVDWDLPGMRVAPMSASFQRADKIIVALKAIAPKAKVIVLSTSPEVKDSVLHAGADAFMCKSEPPQQLLEMIRQIDRTIVDTQTQNPWTGISNIPVEPIE